MRKKSCGEEENRCIREKIAYILVKELVQVFNRFEGFPLVQRAQHPEVVELRVGLPFLEPLDVGVDVFGIRYHLEVYGDKSGGGGGNAGTLELEVNVLDFLLELVVAGLDTRCLPRVRHTVAVAAEFVLVILLVT